LVEAGKRYEIKRASRLLTYAHIYLAQKLSLPDEVLRGDRGLAKATPELSLGDQVRENKH